MITHDEVATILFNYVKNIIYSPQDAYIAKGVLPESYDKLIDGLQLLNIWLQEGSEFALHLSNGELNAPLPPRENKLTEPLKALHSNLLHLTWQTKEIAKGNYKQHIDFMGDFSESFNTMITQLRERKEMIDHNMQVISEKNASLESAAGFFRQLLMLIRKVAVCFNEEQEIIFANTFAEDLAKNNPQIYAELIAAMKSQSKETQREIVLDSEQGRQWFFVERSVLNWDTHPNYLYLADDITDIKLREAAVEKDASEDALTGLFNRRYAMQALQDAYEQKKNFCVAFIDLNRLKYMNDVYGHGAGDLYIMEMANILKNIPQEHLAARVGGDEFLLLVYNWDKATLDAKLEELSTNFYLTLQDKSRLKVSFSYGVVENEHNSSPSQMLRRADELMYQYKFSHKQKLT